MPSILYELIDEFEYVHSNLRFFKNHTQRTLYIGVKFTFELSLISTFKKSLASKKITRKTVYIYHMFSTRF